MNTRRLAPAGPVLGTTKAWSGGLARRLRTAALVTGAALAAAVLPAAIPAVSSGPSAAVDPALWQAHGNVAIIVQAVPGSESAAHVVLGRLGGHVTRELPIVHGFAATVPASAIDKLATSSGIRVLSLDRKTHIQAVKPARSGPDTQPSVYRKVVKADKLSSAGGRGKGITVALIDTGVAPMADLAGRIVKVTTDPLGVSSATCVNFSSEPNCNDSYGHGTFIAGLIAGDGSASGGKYVATAPKAKVLSIKISGADGSADVSQVLAAIQWVVSFRDEYGIRVLNLSLGTDSTQSYRVDPLNYAVEQAWDSGIVVVVAASNRGPSAETISKPGDDPLVITVGASDDNGTVALTDDAIPDFSSHGPTAADGLAKPDLIAPGAHVVSLAAPGSTVSTLFPSNMAAPYRRGSGTSMSAGVVSGLVADMLSLSSTTTPDRIKYALKKTTHPYAGADPMAQGKGLVDGYAARSAPAGLANDGVGRSDGSGSLEDSRGTVHLEAITHPGSPIISGDVTAQLNDFDAVEFLGSWTPLTWWASQWLGTNWTGTNWTGTNWTGTNWTGTNWTGTKWHGTNWTGTNWTGTNWTGTNWTGTNWTGSSWYGTNWTGSAWYGAWDQ